ncbi:MAG: molybdopterin-binding protein [Firmicutes bacterium]|nr:molybdopterin-binding protein [Bacillota bacterium]
MSITGKIIAVCISEAKGTPKQNINTCLLKPDWGLENDAHGGSWHRQVSLLSYDKVQKFNHGGANVSHGDFGENLLVEGIDLAALPVRTLLKCGTALLEVTQIGKECHSKCQIYNKMGDCIMPREGIFAKVLQEGQVSVGDMVEVVLSAAVVTLSDKGAQGTRVDESGKIIANMLKKAGYVVKHQATLPDEQAEIEKTLIDLCDNAKTQLILTTGGTGLSLRDVTPEATLAVAERIVPGIGEAMRAHSMQITPRGMLSRGIGATRGQSLIVNLPGSPKAVKEVLEYILPTLRHGVEILCGLTGECAS